ncbi:MAG TPA: CAP domain-containing protein [Candidatus Sulfotelmatobacter sp.]|nr:CAP domain-containing protein [Candidatus Sulfotelmatobacter sp.]
MLKLSRRLFALALGAGVMTLQPVVHLAAADGSGQSAHRATLKTASANAPDIPYVEYEFQVEQDLLQLANQSRQRAGAPSLVLDTSLTAAARTHAQAMLEAHQLSHQFVGEPTLVQRLAATSSLQLDQAAENVALDYSAQGGHEHLMLSPPHRANLLNPAYNTVGLGVVRSGDRLYIVQDFAHVLPAYSADEVKDRIATAVNQARRHASRNVLSRRDLQNADEPACSMARSDKLGTSPVRQLAQRFTVLTYTSLHPETLPLEASHAIRSPNLHSFSIGACYARTSTYPTGVYWIVLSLD